MNLILQFNHQQKLFGIVYDSDFVTPFCRLSFKCFTNYYLNLIEQLTHPFLGGFSINHNVWSHF